MSEKYLWIIAICIFVVAFFIGWIFGKIISGRKAGKKPDGTLFIEQNEDRDVYRWVFNEELEDFRNRKQLTISVEHSQNSQLVR